MTLYGLKACDTCRTALKALSGTGRTVALTDVRETPPDAATLAEFVARFGDDLVNRRSATWRGLDAAARALPAAELIAAHPTVMKRPVVVEGARMTLGWDAAARGIWGL